MLFYLYDIVTKDYIGFTNSESENNIHIEVTDRGTFYYLVNSAGQKIAEAYPNKKAPHEDYSLYDRWRDIDQMKSAGPHPADGHIGRGAGFTDKIPQGFKSENPLVRGTFINYQLGTHESQLLFRNGHLDMSPMSYTFIINTEEDWADFVADATKTGSDDSLRHDYTSVLITSGVYRLAPSSEGERLRTLSLAQTKTIVLDATNDAYIDVIWAPADNEAEFTVFSGLPEANYTRLRSVSGIEPFIRNIKILSHNVNVIGFKNCRCMYDCGYILQSDASYTLSTVNNETLETRTFICFDTCSDMSQCYVLSNGQPFTIVAANLFLNCNRLTSCRADLGLILLKDTGTRTNKNIKYFSKCTGLNECEGTGNGFICFDNCKNLHGCKSMQVNGACLGYSQCEYLVACTHNAVTTLAPLEGNQASIGFASCKNLNGCVSDIDGGISLNYLVDDLDSSFTAVGFFSCTLMIGCTSDIHSSIKKTLQQGRSYNGFYRCKSITGCHAVAANPHAGSLTVYGYNGCSYVTASTADIIVFPVTSSVPAGFNNVTTIYMGQVTFTPDISLIDSPNAYSGELRSFNQCTGMQYCYSDGYNAKFDRVTDYYNCFSSLTNNVSTYAANATMAGGWNDYAGRAR